MSKSQYSKLTILELKELCRTKNIKNYSGLNKDELVKLVNKNIKSGGMRRDRGLYISKNNLFSMAYYHNPSQRRGTNGKTYDMINVSINCSEHNFEELIKSNNSSISNLKNIFKSIRNKNMHSTPSGTIQRDITLAIGNIIVYNGKGYQIEDIVYQNIVKLMGERVPYAILCIDTLSGEKVTFDIDNTDFWINIFLKFFITEHNTAIASRKPRISENEEVVIKTTNPENSSNYIANRKLSNLEKYIKNSSFEKMSEFEYVSKNYEGLPLKLDLYIDYVSQGIPEYCKIHEKTIDVINYFIKNPQWMSGYAVKIGLIDDITIYVYYNSDKKLCIIGEFDGIPYLMYDHYSSKINNNYRKCEQNKYSKTNKKSNYGKKYYISDN
jgi:hypothetical protein